MKPLAAIVLLVFSISCSGAQDLADTGEEPDSDVVAPGEPPQEEAEPDEAPAPVTADEPEPEPAADRADLVLDDTAYTAFETEFADGLRGSYAVVLTNPNEDWAAEDVAINITFKAGGSPVRTVDEHVSVVLPGQTVAVGDDRDLPEQPDEMDVQARVRHWEDVAGETFGAFSTSGVSVRTDEFGGNVVNAEVSSTFQRDMQDIYVAAVLLDEAGAIVGGSFTFADFVPADGSVGVEVTTLAPVPGVADARVYPSITSLTLLDPDL